MSKQGRWRNWEDQTLALWYKWEFLRRNAQYAAELEMFELSTAEWCIRNGNLHKQIDPKTDTDWKVFCVTIAPEMKRISRAWKVTQPTSPTWEFSKTHGMLITSHSRLKGLSLPFGSEDAWRVWDIEYERPSASEEEWHRRFMRDTAEICDVESESPATLELEDLNEPRKRRRRFDDFDVQLKAWDLRHDGHSVSEIAKLIYPREFEVYRDAASSDNFLFRRVRDHISRAQKRIDGGYGQIV
jgi:hypothetical protein